MIGKIINQFNAVLTMITLLCLLTGALMNAISHACLFVCVDNHCLSKKSRYARIKLQNNEINEKIINSAQLQHH